LCVIDLIAEFPFLFNINLIYKISDSDAAIAIKKIIELMENKNLQNHLAFTFACFEFLLENISKLETKIPLTESLEIIDNVIKQL
jgi:hypothetical protein